jgi:indolepyruvate ferredoxin oxidoreductase
MTVEGDMTKRSYSLEDRYGAETGRVLLTGIQALARIPVEQLRRDRSNGRRTAAFVSGYPGSPLGGFDLEMARVRTAVPDVEIVHLPAVNEELAATAVMGSQLAAGRPDRRVDGVVGIWYGKAPGLDRAGDALRHATFAGTSPTGGAIALVGDDPACKSSTMPSSSDASLVDLHMPILYPGTVAECLVLGLHGIAMSRVTGLWSSLKIVTPVADATETVTLPVLDGDPVLPSIQVDGRPWTAHPSAQFLGDRMIAVEREFHDVRLSLAHEYGAANQLNVVTVDPPKAWIGLLATGYTYQELREALRRLGLARDEDVRAAGIRLLYLRMPVPFNERQIAEFARGLEEVVVVEEKNPTLERLVRDALYPTPLRPLVIGKVAPDGTPLFPSYGLLDADAILPALRSRLASRLGARLAADRGGGGPHPLCLQRLSAQLGHEGPRRIGRGDGYRLSRHDPPHGRGSGRREHRHHGDGQRGGPVARHGPLCGNRPRISEPRRRHLFPFRPTGRAGRHRRRRPHDLQTALQQHGRHDRRPKRSQCD